MIPQHHYLSCVGCGTRVYAYDSDAFSCPNRDSLPEFNHVLQKKHVLNQNLWMRAKIENSTDPFVKYRHRLLSYHRKLNASFSDADYLHYLQNLREALVSVDGRSFEQTPVVDARALGEAIGLRPDQTLLVKDETQNVAGSHKGRHLFGVLLNLDESNRKKDFAIASCGNAALAAAVVAKASCCNLRVFIPTDADLSVVERLKGLGAELCVCERILGESGDPCYLRFCEAVQGGALPFSCQGTDNGLTIEGGCTLAYELFDQWRSRKFVCHQMFVQVGGGALASSSAQALAECMRYEPLEILPRFHTVQTRGAFPLARAYDRLVRVIEARLRGEALPELLPYTDDMDLEERAARHNEQGIPALLETADSIRLAWDSTAVQSAIRYASSQKARFMWAWEGTPHSVAHGILDDETYDWFAIVSTMLRTGGVPLVADEDLLKEAHRLAHEKTSMRPSATGSAGLAGVMLMQRAHSIRDYENISVYFTGIDRD